MWKYEVSNTDHTLMQGVELVNRLLLGEPETTIGMKYESTLDGRNAAVHERSHVAGSGDPKRAAEEKAMPEVKPTAHPGQTGHAGKAFPVAAPQPTATAWRGGPGDQDEAHVSEEELGVTVQEKTVVKEKTAPKEKTASKEKTHE